MFSFSDKSYGNVIVEKQWYPVEILRSNFVTSAVQLREACKKHRAGRSNTWNSHGCSSFMENPDSGPRHARSLVVCSGNADILEQFNISHGEQSGKHVALRLPFSRYSSSRLCISYFYLRPVRHARHLTPAPLCVLPNGASAWTPFFFSPFN